MAKMSDEALGRTWRQRRIWAAKVLAHPNRYNADALRVAQWVDAHAPREEPSNQP